MADRSAASLTGVRAPLPPKVAVIEALLAAAREQCAAVERVAAMARDEASGEESRAEGQYDTRATEASYLARGQAERVADLRRTRSWLEGVQAPPCDSVEVGAMVEVRMRGRNEILFIAPVTAPSVDVEGWSVRVVAFASPLGGALADAVAGDDLEIDGPQGTVSCEVLTVC
ncbi:MAG: hypothetical protein EXR69_09345 [Myxococcales bacterium]|nr:hypothetical protein [Myxococcales bacterium]